MPVPMSLQDFAKTVAEWPSSLYDVKALIPVVIDQLRVAHTEHAPALKEALASLYVGRGRKMPR